MAGQTACQTTSRAAGQTACQKGADFGSAAKTGPISESGLIRVRPYPCQRLSESGLSSRLTRRVGVCSSAGRRQQRRARMGHAAGYTQAALPSACVWAASRVYPSHPYRRPKRSHHRPGRLGTRCSPALPTAGPARGMVGRFPAALRARCARGGTGRPDRWPPGRASREGTAGSYPDVSCGSGDACRRAARPDPS